MNFVSVLLLNVLVAGVAVVSYDVIKGSPEVSSETVYSGVEDVDTGPTEPEPFRAEPALHGNGDEVMRQRIASLEKTVAALQAVIAKGGTPAAEVETASGEPMAAVELPVVDEGDENPEFSDGSLRSFRAMLDQVEAQKREERLKEGLKRQLERLGVELSEDQQEAVMGATMAFRNKTRTMWRNLPRGGDDAAREKRREAMDTVREEYSKTIRSLVPDADAEKIVSGMGRGLGFSTRAFGGRDGGGINRRGR